MSDTFELSEEYIYRVAPDGKSCKSAADLVKGKAHTFRQPKMSDAGLRLEALCKGSDPTPYTVRVDLTRPDAPGTLCDCMSFKRPCKHALGLMFLALHRPDEFERDDSSRRRSTSNMESVAVRESTAEKPLPPPKDTKEAIYQDVLAMPDDDTPRLIYADWLDENGGPDDQARAEFIRVQIELSRSPDDKALRAREKALWAAHKKAWLATLPEALRTRKYVAFHRGFFEELTHAASTWQGCADELFAAHPVFRLKPQSPIDRHRAGELAVVPHMTRIKALMLSGIIKTPAQTLYILFHTPFFSNVTALDVSGAEFGTRDLGVLVESPLSARLKSLTMSDIHLGVKGVETLAESPALGGLERLTLREGSLTPDQVKKLQARFGDRLVRAE